MMSSGSHSWPAREAKHEVTSVGLQSNLLPLHCSCRACSSSLLGHRLPLQGSASPLPPAPARPHPGDCGCRPGDIFPNYSDHPHSWFSLAWPSPICIPLAMMPCIMDSYLILVLFGGNSNLIKISSKNLTFPRTLVAWALHKWTPHTHAHTPLQP